MAAIAQTVAPNAPVAEPARLVPSRGGTNGHIVAASDSGALVLFKPVGERPAWEPSHHVRLGWLAPAPATMYSSWLRPWSR